MCGTDEHLLHGGFIAKLPLIPAHEIVGEVAGLRAGVEGIAVGTRVVVDSAIYCGECASCGRGEPLFCQRFVSLGCKAPGGFAEYVAVRASKTYPIGDQDTDVAVLTETTTCALHGIDVLNLRAASHALIFGAGPTGLLLVQLLQMSGAASATVAAPTPSKLELAQRSGLTAPFRSGEANRSRRPTNYAPSRLTDSTRSSKQRECPSRSSWESP